jgi:threonine dehydratase
MASSLPTYEDVKAAAHVLNGIAHITPVLTSTTFNEKVNANVFFKCENFQRMGAFKFRGAYNSISNLSVEQREAGVVTYSSGNHAQAIALSGKLLGVKTTIIMPHDAPTAKKAATQEYGAEIVSYDRYKESREDISKEIQRATGMTLIPPYDHFHVIAGQGTAAKELFESVGELDVLVVCLGGGGLLSGCALAAKALSPQCKIYGVEPLAGNDGQQSLRKGEVVKIAPPVSIADGALTLYLGQLTFNIIKETVTDIVTVTDDQIITTMKFFAERMKLVVEPTGCLAAAAILHGCIPMPEGARVGALVSGGNIDLAAFGGFINT